jgi:FkbM family methyltransferase
MIDSIWVNLSRILVVKAYFDAILLYRSRFKNYLSVIIDSRQKKYPIKVKLRNNEYKNVLNREELSSLLYEVDYDHYNDIVNLEKLGYPIKLVSAISNGELIPVFKNKDYAFLDVKGKPVIDIGANIADSSIYFAAEGASHVIALEPYPKNYQIAKKNIELNNLNSKITLLQAGGGSRDQNIFINSDYAGICKPLETSSSGEKAAILSLDTLTNKFNINSGLLKMDCEGCEYDTILNSSIPTLKKFSKIQIEYHYGYKDLCNKLKDCGFKVNVTKPIYIKNIWAKKDMQVGYIYADQT